MAEAEPAPGQSGLSAADLETLRQRLLYFAARRLRNWAEAEDVAQETIWRTLEALQDRRIENPAALPAFVFQTALHICQRRGRSAGRESRALRRFGASPEDTREDDPLKSLISAERRASVRDAIARLDADDREVLTLSYSEALQTAEIARRLGLTEGNVRVRRHRALNRLAEILGVTRRPEREP